MTVDISALFDEDPLTTIMRRRRLQEQAMADYQPPPPALTQADAESMLSGLGHGATTTLQWVGEALNKPGRALRGLLAGRPEELANLIPFSDSLGITDPAKSVTGDDLLDQWGVRSKDREAPETWYGHVADALPGFATELLTDPLVLANVSPFAKTAAGLAKVKAGQPLAKGWLNQVAAGERSLLGAGGTPILGHGTGLDALSGPSVASGLRSSNAFLDALPVVGPAKRAVGAGAERAGTLFRQLFDPDVNNAGNRLLQESQAAQAAAKDVWTAENVRGPVLDVVTDLARKGVLKADDAAANEAVSMTVRGLMESKTPVASPFNPDILDAVDRLKGIRDRWIPELEASGARAPVLSDIFAEYAPRQANLGPGQSLGSGGFGRETPTASGHQVKRVSALRDIPGDPYAGGSTETLNRIARRGDITGTATARGVEFTPDAMGKRDYRRVVQNVRDEFGIDAGRYRQLRAARKTELDAAATGVISPDEVSLLRLGRTGKLVDPADVQAYQSLMANVPEVMGEADYHLWRAGARTAPKTAREFAQLPKALPRGAYPNSVFEDMLGAGLRNAEVKYNAEAAGNALMAATRGRLPAGTQAVSAATAFKKAGIDPAAHFPPGADLDNLFVPRDLLADVMRRGQGLNLPSASGPVVDMLRGATNAWKAFATGFLPFTAGTSVRNKTYNLFRNALEEGVGLDAYNLASATVKGAQTPEAQALARSAARYGVVGGGPTMSSPGLLGVNDIAPELSRVPGLVPRTVLGELASGVKALGTAEGRNPLNIRGLASEQNLFGPVKAGQAVNQLVDDQARLALYAQRVSEGYTEQAAAAAVRNAYGGKLTEFEKRVMLPLVPFYRFCVPDYTQAFTRDGWKTCDELKPGDEVLTYNRHDERLEWERCEAVNVFDFDGELIRHRGKNQTIDCTGDHRWVFQNRSSGEQSLRPFDELPTTGATVVVAGRLGSGGPSAMTPAQARLVGWLITDGYFRHRGKHTEAVVYQSPKKYLAEVTEVAGGVPRRPHPDTGVIAVPVLKGRLYEVRQFLNPEQLLYAVTRLSVEAAEAMYDAMYKADGTVGKRMSDSFSCEKWWVREAFLALCVLLGKRAAVPTGGKVYVSHRKTMKFYRSQTTALPYKGRVWCPTTANGTWVMRQHRFIGITGNSRASVPYELGQLAGRPGGPSAVGARAAEYARRGDNQFLPDYLGSGLALPVGQEDEAGRKRYLTGLQLPFEQPFEIFDKRGVGQTLMHMLGQTNPLVKGIAEQATNRQFYSGRDLSDLYTPTNIPGVDPVLQSLGIAQPVQQLLMNSPAQRPLSWLRQLLDERKYEDGGYALGANLLTGAKLSDVDVAAARRRKASDVIEELLKGTEGVVPFEGISVRPEVLAKMPPEKQELVQLYRALQRRR